MKFLIVGTFNPIWDSKNNASFFYGRTQNNMFWDILPRVFNKPTLIQRAKQQWVDFLRTNNIALTDMIEEVEDADEHDEKHIKWLTGYNFSDDSLTKNFKKLRLTPIVDIIKERKTIQEVYFTRGDSGYWRKPWKEVKDYCHKNQMYCSTLLTPSKNARYQYDNSQKLVYPELTDFVLHRWKCNFNK